MTKRRDLPPDGHCAVITIPGRFIAWQQTRNSLMLFVKQTATQEKRAIKVARLKEEL